ncbi:polysaccharide biosynthesis C-terminal domain-containing protein [Halobacteriovorax sp. GB3]|uniref:oligosaccharide flippase family protein n=1 Tax=Halobacteriovorax sp. GB3 TaxID=2719615 RepID=UPI00235E0494|nr:polysaccharide biosynthesis C-terminal domain-containing protein [Halobacteriovorax sp. GB3]MDD0852513.1 polysaccharide biosynthesis C-terminal domain-containing protein [Halobacteriovorax sp. GB3]
MMIKRIQDFFRRGAVAYLVAQLLSPVFSFLIVVLLTRSLSTEVYGEYVIYITSINFLTLFGSSWVGTSILRFYSSQERSKESTYGSLILTQIFASLIVILSAIFINFFFPLFPGATSWMIVQILVFYLLNSLVDLNLCTLRADENATGYALVFVLNNLMKLGVVLCSVFLTKDISYLFSLWACSTLLSFLFVIFLVSKSIKISSLSIDKSFIKEVLHFGLPTIMTGVGGLILIQSDRYMINILLGPESVSFYNVSNLIIANSLGVIGTTLIMTYYSKIVDSWELKQDTSYVIDKGVQTYLLFALPAIVGIFFVSKDVFATFFDERYQAANEYVPYLLITAFISALLQYYQKSFLLLKRMKLQASLYTVAGALNIVLNLVLIPKLQVTGAALATCISFAFLLILVLGLNFKLNIRWGFPILFAVKSMISCLVMGASLFLFQRFVSINSPVLSLILSIGIGAAAYYIVMTLFGVRSSEFILKKKVME